jgi:hypothetical protein
MAWLSMAWHGVAWLGMAWHSKTSDMASDMASGVADMASHLDGWLADMDDWQVGALRVWWWCPKETTKRVCAAGVDALIVH